MAEEPAADNVVVRAVEFEEEGFADLEGTELLLPAGLPKVDLVESVHAGQEIEPITIRDPDEETHAPSEEFALSQQASYNAQPLRVQRLSAHGLTRSAVPVGCVALIAFPAMQVAERGTRGSTRASSLRPIKPVVRLTLFATAAASAPLKATSRRGF